MHAIGPITDAFRFANYVEAGFWAAIGAGFAIRAMMPRREERRSCAAAAVALLAFGASDIVEAGTGAWWHPRWLLVWKGLCVLALMGLVGRWILLRRRRPAP